MHKQAETWGGGIDIIVSSPLQILGPGTSLPPGIDAHGG